MLGFFNKISDQPIYLRANYMFCEFFLIENELKSD